MLLGACAFFALSCGSGSSPDRGPAGDGADRSASPGSPAATGAAAFDQPFAGAKVYPVVVSSELVVGENRFLVALFDHEDAPTGSPETSVRAEFFDLDDSAEEPVAEADLDFIWAIEPVRGLYKTDVRFDEPGHYGIAVTVKGPGLDELVRGSFDVAEEGSSPGIGEKVPASATPTARSGGSLEEITTDRHPELRFYDTSVKEAVGSGEPFVVTFATPKFCSSSVCGPTLETVKEVAEDFPKLTFIHVEVYTNLGQPDNLKVVPSVEEWGLPSEPWVFVVDGRGRVAAKYEGVVSADELRDALKAF